MQFIEIKDKELWNSWVSAQPFSQFLQSWEWGKFHKKMGRKILRLAVMDDANKRECEHEFTRMNASGSRDAINRVSTTSGNMMLAAAQVIKYELPFGQSYLYCPRGPAQNAKCKMQNAKLWNILFDELKELAERERCMFLRIEPGNELKVIKSKVHKVRSVQPENEWLLDLSKSENELLKGMHHKTRYNLRLAGKNSVKIRVGEGKNDFDEFFNLISSTYSRKEIRTHSKEYYQGILGMGAKEAISGNMTGVSIGGLTPPLPPSRGELKEDAQTKLWVAKFENKIIAANIVSYFGDTVTYMHGGADYNYRNLMAPYLLQWEAIKEAKIKGYRYYNFGGISGGKERDGGGSIEIAPKFSFRQAWNRLFVKGNSWTGITRFKKGFGGFELNYAGTYEIVANRLKYFTYKMAKKLQ
ncbi:MAG: peptidoglycan bridge formation glycyltransferase FemA/FemB family protein [bacterium]